MRKIFSLLSAYVLIFSFSTQAQFSVSGGTGLAATYSSLTNTGGLFEAINATAQTGNNIVVSVTGNSTSETGTVSLNAGAWTSITISPSGGAGRTISGAASAGTPLINFNGADNVTIDGLKTGGNSLTISNTTVSGTSNTSTIRFIGGATNNTITNCSIQGSFNSSTITTNGGIIFFSTDANTANGNDNNTISNNDIGPAGTNLPVKAIYGNGSTTTTAIGNSGNVINNNNIFDYFLSNGTSSGLYINNGCNTWSITNNRFYQTATRTWSSGATHSAINIQGTTSPQGAQGFTITGNIIGYAASNQTGTYTLTGSTGKFQGIVFNGITGATSSSISSNTIASVSLTGVTSNGTGSSSTPFAGIIVVNGVAATNSNTIGSQSATGALTFSTNSTTATDVYGIYNFSSDAWTSNSNNIGGISVTNAAASGTYILYCMRANTGTTLSWTANNNNVGGTVANSISLTATGTSSQVIGMHSGNAAMSFTGNTIRNLTTNIGTGTTTSASVIGICHTSTTPVNTLSQNTIFNLSNTNTTAASVVTGIQFTGGTGNVVERNLIYGLTVATNSASAEVNGIRVGGGTTTYRNNMIALGAGISNAIGAAASNSSASGINGFNGSLGTDNFWHNSIYIGGTATAGSGASYAFNGVQTTNTRSFRNNIFFNARTNSGAIGKHYAVKINGTGANPTGLTINNNVYFVNGTGGVFGYFNSADVANLAAWRTAVGQDLASIEGNPQFAAPAATTPDLHINPSIATPAEANGTDLGVTNDFDGETRSGLTPVDIGADAGNFTGADFSAPVITYTALGNTCTLTGLTLTATITDAGSGVPTTGIGLPVLYWRVNAGSYTAVTGSFVSGNTYSFGPFGSGSVGDVISYYIVAQDGAATPNVAASPAAGSGSLTANPPAAGTPPTSPSSFNLQSSLSGTYTVGSGGNYATLSAAVTAYNNSCLTGPVVFSLTDASYTSGSGETFPITINANSFASATNTLTFKTTQANTSISGSAASAIIVLNGADYVIIDGSVSNTANTVCPASAASRDLTITNSNTGTSSAVIWLQTATGSNAATNNVIQNINLVGNSNTTTLFGAGSGSNTISVSSAGTNNNNNSFVNNNISKTQYGIYSGGASAGNKNTGNIINQNLINTGSPNNVGIGGILVGFENNITISGNTISEINGSSDRFAISAGFSNSFGATSTGTAEVTNATITNNIIGNVIGNGTNSSIGIALSSAASGTSLIANNMVYGVSHNSTSPDFAAGIVVGGGAATTNVYHNTVSMQGTITGGTAATQTSACFAITSASSPTGLVDVKNNIFSNTQANNSGTSMRFAAIALGYSSSISNYAGIASNNNDLYAAGTLGTYTVGITGGITAQLRTTLSAWTAETGRDAASLNVLPVFTGLTDLHLNNTSNPLLDGAGATGTGVTSDIDCETRSGTPDIGADEFESPNCTGATGGTATGDVSFCGSGTPTITASGYSTGNTSGYQWYTSTNAGDYPNGGTAVSGQTNPASLTTGVVSVTTYYWLRVTCTAASATDNSNMITVTVNPLPAAVNVSGAGTFCSNATITADNGNDGTIYFQGTTSGGTSTATASTSETVTSSGTYYFRAQSAQGCWGQEGNVTVVIQTDPGLTGTNASICVGGAGTIAAVAANSCAGFANSGTTLNGTLTAATDPIATRLTGMSNSTACAFTAGVTRNYTAQQFQVSVTGNYVFDMTASSLSDNMGYIVTGNFVPGSCATGTFVRGDDDDGTGNLPRMGASGVGAGTMTLTAGVTYTLITLNYSATSGTASGTYTWTITPPSGGQIMLPANGNIEWYTAASGGTAIGTGSPFNPVGVAGSGLNDTNTPGTTTYYAACSNASACRTPVTFTINPNYTVTASAGSNGSISPAGVTTLTCEGTGSQAYTITPDACYSVADVLVNGSSVGAVTSYTFNNVASNQTISASFVLNTYNITASAGTGGSISPAGAVSVNCGSNQSFTITPDACYSIADVLVDGVSVGAVGSYTFTNVTAAHTISASFVLNTYTITVTAGANGSITPGTGSVNCGSNASYTITPDPGYNVDDVVVDGVSQGAILSYTFTNVQTTHTISASFVLAACINNNFSGTGNWTDGTKWSCGAPPNPGDNVTILAGANVTLNTDFTVAGTFSMGTGATMTVSPDQTFAVSGSANFNGQAVTFRSDATGNGRLGQVTGTLSGATNVTVERYLPNNGFRSWRLLSVPTSGTQTIRQSWQENNAPLANNVPGYGTLITGGGNNTGASQALGFDFSGPNTSMLFWNNTGWGNISGTLGAISARQAYFLYVRGDRSKTVTGLVTDAGSTTLRTRGTIYTGDQVIPALNTFSLVPNLYPSAIDFRQLTRSGVANNFTLWDSKTQLGNQLGMYVTFSATNDFLPNIGTNSYPLTTRNARIESGQAFFVNGGAGASITLKEVAKISDSANGNLGLRPVKREKLVTALETADGTLLDGNTVVFDAAFANAVNEDDAQKMGNPGANFGIETANKLLSVEGRQVAEEQDAVQFRMWNLSTGSYVLNLQAGRIAKAGVEAFLEDSYTGIQTPLELNGNTKVNFTVDASAASKAANRFRVVFGKAGTRTGTYSIAPNPVEGGVMNVVLKSQQPGRHTIKVLSAQGQVLSTRVIEHAGGNGNQQISLPAGLSRGAYLVEFISPDKTRTVQTLFVNKK